MRQDSKKFYVYAYLNPLQPGQYVYDNYTFDFRPFYIGKGAGDRAEAHLKEAKGELSVTNEYKVRKIQQLLEEGSLPYVVRVDERLTRSEALRLEKQLIAHFGISVDGGLLTNLGHGSLAASWTSDVVKFVYLVLRAERDRLDTRRAEISEKIDALPKGSFSVKRRWNQHYVYLAYREGEKVKFDYVGKAGLQHVEELRRRLANRDQLLGQLRQIKQELSEVDRLIYPIELGIDITE